MRPRFLENRQNIGQLLKTRMNSHGNRRPPHLSVVTPIKRGSGGKVCSVEEAPPESRGLVEELLQSLGVRGVLSGILLGSRPWDSRPILLADGAMWLIRLSDPRLTEIRSPRGMRIIDELRELIIQNQDTDSLLMGEYQTVWGRHLWVRRRFYPSTWEEIPAHEAVGEANLPKQLLDALGRFHAQGNVHGHIVPANIVTHQGTVRLIDPGFARLSGIAPVGELPPELAVEGSVGQSGDIFGAGRVFKKWYDEVGYPSEAIKECVQFMVQPDRSMRPSHELLEEVFGLTSSLPRRSSGISKRIITQETLVSPPSPKTPLLSRKALLVTLAIALGCIAALILPPLVSEVMKAFKGPELPESTLTDYWQSGTPSFMRQVVEEALVQHNDRALFTIVRSAKSNKKNTTFNAELIDRAFNPKWEGELQWKDKELVLQIALSQLLPPERKEVTLSSKTHPGVLLALLSTLPVSGRGEEFSSIPVEKIATLQEPFGDAYKNLGALGIKTLNEPAARALSHILFQDFSPDVIALYIAQISSSDHFHELLALIVSLIPLDNKPAQIVYLACESLPEPRSSLFSWFKNTRWGKVSYLDKLSVVSGVIPQLLRTDDLLSDLLTYPYPLVRAEVKKILLQQGHFNPSLIEYVASPENQLSREGSTHALELTKQGAVDESHAQALIIGKESPKAIVEVLIRYHGPEGKASKGTLSLASYLAQYSGEIELSSDQRNALLTHPDSLVRAIAYSKLNESLLDDRKIIEQRIQLEQSPRLKQELQERLRGTVRD